MKSKSSQKVKLTPSFWDITIVIAVLALAFGIWFSLLRQSTSGDLICVISQNGEELDRIDLSKLQDPTEIQLDSEYSLTIHIESDRVCVESATCPTQDCVHTGWISRSGQSIVCLPARTIVELISDNGGGDFDVVVE